MSEREAAGLKTVTRRMRTPGKPCKYRVGDVVAFGEALTVDAVGLTVYARDNGSVREVDAPHRYVSWKWKPAKLAGMYCPAWAARRFGRIVSVEPREEVVAYLSTREVRLEGFRDRQEMCELWVRMHGASSWWEMLTLWRIRFESISREEAFAADARRKAA
jgi:hypothetical protein